MSALHLRFQTPKQGFGAGTNAFATAGKGEGGLPTTPYMRKLRTGTGEPTSLKLIDKQQEMRKHECDNAIAAGKGSAAATDTEVDTTTLTGCGTGTAPLTCPLRHLPVSPHLG